uniref:Uncharacterized protein n=1 Tax=Anguilla anguilla TaxID=7936 RepID=A0A0E9VJ45_ANGAN
MSLVQAVVPSTGSSMALAASSSLKKECLGTPAPRLL